jgi:hypothetical protein
VRLNVKDIRIISNLFMEHGFACKNTQNLMYSPPITLSLHFYLFSLPIAIGTLLPGEKERAK